MVTSTNAAILPSWSTCSALVIAMIAVPVAALAFGAVTYDTFELTPAENAERLMGAADAAVAWTYDGPVTQHPTSPDFIAVTGWEDGAAAS